MGKISRILIYLFLGAISWMTVFVRLNDIKNPEEFVYNFKAKFISPCSAPLYYSVGDVDERFGISEVKFREIVQKAEDVWEEASDKNLFEYKKDSDFKINLIFDERQLGTLEGRKLEEKLASVESLQKNISSEYDGLLAEYDRKKKSYERAVEEYNNDLEDYQDQVKYWNNKGGAPEDEYEKLQDESADLKDKAQKLEKERKELNTLVQGINSLVKKSEKITSEYNQEAQTYRDRFGESREFDQGLYTGEEINIYQFNEMTDLELVLAHELGHYLGIEHLENPESIMYYLMDEQDLENIRLTREDLVAVERICK